MRFVRRCSVLAAIFAIAAAAQSSTDPKKDPDQIGTRDVSKGVNWYSVQKEMALGKALAAQVAANSEDRERSGGIGIREPAGAEPGAQFGHEIPAHDAGARETTA